MGHNLELGRGRAVKTVANQATAGQIKNTGHEKPTFVGWDIRNVSAPSLIDRIAVELTVNQIRQSSQVVVTVRGSNVFAMVAMEDAVAS